MNLAFPLVTYTFINAHNFGVINIYIYITREKEKKRGRKRRSKKQEGKRGAREKK